MQILELKTRNQNLKPIYYRSWKLDLEFGINLLQISESKIQSLEIKDLKLRFEKEIFEPRIELITNLQILS